MAAILTVKDSKPKGIGSEDRHRSLPEVSWLAARSIDKAEQHTSHMTLPTTKNPY